MEMLLAMLILTMATSVLAGGLPVAVDAYRKVVDYANAQALLTTTMTRLRDELGTGRDIKIQDGVKTIEYINTYGNRLCVYSVQDDDSEEKGLFLEYTIPRPAEDPGGEASTEIIQFPLVSNGTAPKNLHADYDSVNYTDGVLTINNLHVMKSAETLASVNEFKIRVLTYVP